MPLFQIRPRFYPIKLNAYSKSEVELTIDVENLSNDACWSECDVILPPEISLSHDASLTKGRLRVGIIDAKGSRSGKCKIYSTLGAYPGVYTVSLIVYAYGKDGAIAGREEKKTDIRCEGIRK
ncbi:hypothetical protein HY992_01465 [Candidatus Micrarchaeota archaeon]|nr:hypothetical protein [Candidatus Micrarchaeota archaeon]